MISFGETILKSLPKYRREQFEKRLSASQIRNYEIKDKNGNITKDYKQLVYSIVEPRENKEFNAMTIGSLVDLGIQMLLHLNGNYHTQVDLQPIKINDWLITGTPDIINFKDKVIYDIKTTNYKTYKSELTKLNKGIYSDYCWQLNIYNYLQKISTSVNLFDKLEIGEDFRLFISFIFKDGGWDWNTKSKIPTYIELEYPIIPEYKIKEKIIEITNDLNKLIDFKNKTFKKDVFCKRDKYQFLTHKNGKREPRRCAMYCQYSDICNMYNNNFIRI